MFEAVKQFFYNSLSIVFAVPLFAAATFGSSVFWSESGKTLGAVDDLEAITAWNKSVLKLGLNSVYPPSEDFHVGDLWAVLIDTDNPERDNTDKPALARAVRITHLDIKDIQPRPSFNYVGTKLDDKSIVQFDQDDRLIPSTQDNMMSVVNFPGLVISSKRNINISAFGAKADFDDHAYEIIKIKSASTYGKSTVDALIRLGQFCETSPMYCSDAFARRVLASAVTDEALVTHSKNGSLEYKYSIQLRLVSRVYVTRDIEQRKYYAVDGKLVSEATAERLLGGAAGAQTSVDSGLMGPARRPLAFGYRAVNQKLPKSIPDANAAR